MQTFIQQQREVNNMPPKVKLVLYRRLSKEKLIGEQHGFDVQEYDIERYLNTLPNYEIVGEYGEFFSGRGSFTSRKELMKALEVCKAQGATLVVTKPDRLSRDVESGAHLINNYDIVFTNHPDANTMMKNILLTIAQNESDTVSERTKAALKVAKLNGVKLGASSEKYDRKELTLRNKRTSTKAKEFAEKYRSQIELMCSLGMTYSEMAKKMKDLVLKTVRDCYYTACSVRNLCILLDIDKESFNKEVVV